MKRVVALVVLTASLLTGCDTRVAQGPEALKEATRPQRGASGMSEPQSQDAPSDSVAPRQAASAGAFETQPVWVALEGAGKVAKVDVASRRVLRRFEVPGAPHNLTVGARGP
jgi:hypothetical protein